MKTKIFLALSVLSFVFFSFTNTEDEAHYLELLPNDNYAMENVPITQGDYQLMESLAQTLLNTDEDVQATRWRKYKETWDPNRSFTRYYKSGTDSAMRNDENYHLYSMQVAQVMSKYMPH